MKDFNIEIKDSRTGEWLVVTSVSFRFHKNHPSDGINSIHIIRDCERGIEKIEPIHINDIRFNIW